jgi:hypothetical protein
MSKVCSLGQKVGRGGRQFSPWSTTANLFRNLPCVKFSMTRLPPEEGRGSRVGDPCPTGQSAVHGLKSASRMSVARSLETVRLRAWLAPGSPTGTRTQRKDPGEFRAVMVQKQPVRLRMLWVALVVPDPDLSELPRVGREPHRVFHMLRVLDPLLLYILSGLQVRLSGSQIFPASSIFRNA